MNRLMGIVLGLMLVSFSCAHVEDGNNGQMQSYPFPVIEAGWIRNGEPLVYEGDKWYAVRDVEYMMDSEVYQIGEYKDVQIFVDKLDVKPYQRIYTKFAKNKFRYFERQKND